MDTGLDPRLDPKGVGTAFVSIVAIALREGDPTIAARARIQDERSSEAIREARRPEEQFVLDALTLTTTELMARWAHSTDDEDKHA